MRFRPMSLACQCGKPPGAVHAVGFSSEYELVVQWTCAHCGNQIFVVKSLADCCRECPESEESEEIRSRVRMEDVKFLHRLGIAVPEG